MIRIIYTVENLSRLLRIERKAVRHLTTIGLLPSIPGRSPMQYYKDEIDAWLTPERLAAIQSPGNRIRKGRYGVVPR